MSDGLSPIEAWFAAIRARDYEYVLADVPVRKCSRDANGDTGLILSVRLKDKALVEILAAHEYNCRDKEGQMALEIAYNIGFIEGCLLLSPLESATLIKEERLLLHEAVRYRQIDMIDALNEGFCTSVDEKGRTPLELAIALALPDEFIEHLANTTCLPLELLDSICRNSSSIQPRLTAVIVACRNQREAEACERCSHLRRQLHILSLRFKELYNALLGDDTPASPKSASLEKHARRPSNLAKMLPPEQREQGEATPEGTRTISEFELTREFLQLRNLLPNAAFNLDADPSRLDSILEICRLMRHRLFEQAKELAELKQQMLNKSKPPDDLPLITENEMTDDTRELDFRHRVESGRRRSSGISPRMVLEDQDSSLRKELAEAVQAITVKDKYIQSLEGELEELRERPQHSPLDQSERKQLENEITNLVEQLRVEREKQSAVSELETQIQILKDDRDVLQQRLDSVTADAKKEVDRVVGQLKEKLLTYKTHYKDLKAENERLKKECERPQIGDGETVPHETYLVLEHKYQDSLIAIDVLSKATEQNQAEIERLREMLALQKSVSESRSVEASKLKLSACAGVATPPIPTIPPQAPETPIVLDVKDALNAKSSVLVKTPSPQPNTPQQPPNKVTPIDCLVNVMRDGPGQKLARSTSSRTYADRDFSLKDSARGRPSQVQRSANPGSTRIPRFSTSSGPGRHQRAESQIPRSASSSKNLSPKRQSTGRESSIRNMIGECMQSLAGQQAVVRPPKEAPPSSTSAAPRSSSATGRIPRTTRDRPTGTTRLMRYAMKGELANVRIAKKDAGMQDSEGRSALFYAANYNHPNVVKELIAQEAGLVTNKTYREGAGFTALMAACREGSVDCIRLLYLWESDIVMPDGRSCMDFARDERIAALLRSLEARE
ncbi:Ankyrin repeat protein 1 [Giardia muris]|uniref:Ankyrin repeat protein 1 n=1 Tax=Giardia muris TaxID=5742 RepID=A0A4Z1T8M3_GIAMU|nr:Ankyrin repeat protein 1 [Giardia muris]|eukprot:TNJ28861.1 Ankyrin repeat protein 1 [Giardia muris]